jgi:hypothetical protein
MLANLLHPILAIMSISTAAGVLVHDTRIDKAAVSALAVPSIMASIDGSSSKLSALSGDMHTHVERGSLAQAVHDLKAQNPRIQPRIDERKHFLQKHVARGYHAFDNYNLPIV